MCIRFLHSDVVRVDGLCAHLCIYILLYATGDSAKMSFWSDAASSHGLLIRFDRRNTHTHTTGALEKRQLIVNRARVCSVHNSKRHAVRRRDAFEDAFVVERVRSELRIVGGVAG